MASVRAVFANLVPFRIDFKDVVLVLVVVDPERASRHFDVEPAVLFEAGSLSRVEVFDEYLFSPRLRLFPLLLRFCCFALPAFLRRLSFCFLLPKTLLRPLRRIVRANDLFAPRRIRSDHNIVGPALPNLGVERDVICRCGTRSDIVRPLIPDEVITSQGHSCRTGVVEIGVTPMTPNHITSTTGRTAVEGNHD